MSTPILTVTEEVIARNHLAAEPAAPMVLVGHLDPATGKMTWVAHECPLCMKAILDEEWQAHQAWHATALDEPGVGS